MNQSPIRLHWPPTDAPASWWMDWPRDAFTERAWREVDRMSKNRECYQVSAFSLEKIAAPLPGKVAFKNLERGL